MLFVSYLIKNIHYSLKESFRYVEQWLQMQIQEMHFIDP